MESTESQRMNILREGSLALGIDLSNSQLDQFELFYHEMTEWNKRANLTSIEGYAEVQAKHFLDSLTATLPIRRDALSPLLSLPGTGRVIDIGSGAGFPGLPLKIAFPEIELHLVESVRKKTAFLEHVAAALGLDDVTVHTGRTETLAWQPGLRESFDLALVRGVARLPLLLEYALPFCRTPSGSGDSGGRTVALKHGGLDTELAEARFALEELGGEEAGVFPVTLPQLQDNRVVACFNKIRPTPDRYPRRVGIPAKRPLATRAAR